MLVQVLGADGEPRARPAGSPAALRAGWRRASTCSRSRWPARSTAIPWTSCSRATSRSTRRTARAPTAWASVAATRWTPRSWCPDPSLSARRGRRRRRFGNAELLAAGHLGGRGQHMGVSRPTPWEDMPRQARRRPSCRAWARRRSRVDYVTVRRPRDVLVHRAEGALAAVMRRYQEAQTDAQREHLEQVLRHGAVPDVPRCAPEARDPGRHRGRQRSIHDVTEM